MSRGFQSSVPSYLNFGLGSDDEIKKITVIWNNGNQEVLSDVQINSTIEFDINNSTPKESDIVDDINRYFESEDIIEYKHEENIYNDYVKEVLLPHENSRLGPGIASGDINGDGFEDFVIGGAKDQITAMFFQIIEFF